MESRKDSESTQPETPLVPHDYEYKNFDVSELSDLDKKFKEF